MARTALTKFLAKLGVARGVSRRKRSERPAISHPKKQEQEPNDDAILYGVVLAVCYPKGYRLNSSIEIKKFRRYFQEINGVELTQEAEVVEDIIRGCGIEHDGKVYSPITMLSDELRDKLFSYIDKTFASGKTVIYFEALFWDFKEDFLDYPIYDSEMLKSYISYTASNKFYIAKKYMSVDQRAEADPMADVRACLKEQGAPVMVDELCKTLSNIPTERIKSLLGSNGEFVRNSKGEYFHVDSFSVTDEELEDIADLIDAEIEERIFISGNELDEAIKR